MVSRFSILLELSVDLRLAKSVVDGDPLARRSGVIQSRAESQVTCAPNMRHLNEPPSD